MAPKKTPAPIPIGNCEVLIEASKYVCESDPNSLQISISKNTRIKISVRDDMNGKSRDDFLLSKSEVKERPSNDDDYVFLLVNPKEDDSCTKSYLQEVLNLYARELPTMNYAANTGKQSKFLERCVSNGKYCTLLLTSKPMEGSGEVIAAITYQILPADTQHAEIPLAAVSSIHQLKGFGKFLYMELKKRLQDIGIRIIYCWADKESEDFWLKQGFVSIAEVDKKGRARRLPIKTDLRKAMCFPGGSTLMVSHLRKDISGPAESLKFQFPLKPCEKSSSSTIDESVGQRRADTAVNLCSCSSQGAKRKMWEASLSSLKTKRVKGSHNIDYQTDSDYLVSESYRNCCFNECSLSISTDKSPMKVTPGISLIKNSMENNSKESGPVSVASQAPICDELQANKNSFRIMLMDIADDAKKARLVEVIESLGGALTSDGSSSTHIVTGKVRKTLNFCTALCSGAWVVSNSWLKESFRKGKFVEELPYVLQDEEYKSRYRTELKDAVLRAIARPRALLKGYNICIAAHVQPSAAILNAIIKSAGANIIHGLDKVNEAWNTIFIASEDDMEEALSAAKRGILTFSSDWLMNCVMGQELDLDAPQFAESL
ncbi:hypothetical protein SLEP1_g49147 [Rubroshorea leprosula]|uniref:Uncharacterized protein n=1 Tax=Rubroshorea leprosula TaxID=152421 RepID=A0AAV5LVW6_9ROSI|nr:hypothetical protein SLEP1_g49147 [Rubroshorea leprosula]